MENGDEDKSKVVSVDNNIFYNGRIDHAGSSEFQKHLYKYIEKCSNKNNTINDNIDNTIKDNKYDKNETQKEDVKCGPLNIHITSGGGSVASGLAMMNAVEDANNNGIETISWSKGFVGSASTYVAFACKKRFSFENTVFLLHPPSKSGVSGQTLDIETSAENLRTTHDNIMNVYQKYTTKPSMINSIQDNFENNKYSLSKTMLKFGLVDDIIKKNY
jgi:ATP-dependent protease ClpP protease subunit